MSLFGAMQGLRTAQATGTGIDPVVDLCFELSGEVLPHDYPAALERAILDVLPEVADDPVFGIHRIRAPLTQAGYVLSRRARLQLRVASSKVARFESLGGRTIDVGGAALSVGRPVTRPVTAFPTLRAQMVVNRFDDEQAFMDDVGMQLEVLEVKGEAMCGKPAELAGADGILRGFALVMHGLSMADSLRLQVVGLGARRRLGCGLFVHHKVIDSLDAWPE